MGTLNKLRSLLSELVNTGRQIVSTEVRLGKYRRQLTQSNNPQTKAILKDRIARTLSSRRNAIFGG